jgi:hypothetical protein
MKASSWMREERRLVARFCLSRVRRFGGAERRIGVFRWSGLRWWITTSSWGAAAWWRARC